MKTMIKQCVSCFSVLRNSITKLYTHFIYRSQFKRYIKRNGYSLSKAEGEGAYTERWKELSSLVEPYSYRLFCHYLNSPKDIVPEALGRCIIERCLNDYNYTDAYTDKNLFPEIVGRNNVPKTIAARIMGGRILNANFKPAIDFESTSYKSLILKPSKNGSSGLGVRKFSYRNGKYKSVDTNEILSEELLYDYGDDFVLQVGIEQCDLMNKLCKTAVNTIRLAVYRSVKTEQVHVLAAVFPYLIQISYLLENQRGFSKRGDSPTTIPQQFQLL